jgi:hypothetical protein
VLPAADQPELVSGRVKSAGCELASAPLSLAHLGERSVPASVGYGTARTSRASTSNFSKYSVLGHTRLALTCGFASPGRPGSRQGGAQSTAS